MTMNVKDEVFTVSSKRKTHPNAGRYPCRATQEINSAFLKLLSGLSPQDMNLLKNNKLIIDEEETAELYDEFKVDDIVGIAILRSQGGFKSNSYKITKIVTGEDYLLAENLKTKEIEEISFQDVSVAFALGFAEILYRDEKPYGVSENIEFDIKIILTDEERQKIEEKKAEKLAAEAAAAANTPEASQESEISETENQ